jgi:hypothetical protein
MSLIDTKDRTPCGLVHRLLPGLSLANLTPGPLLTTPAHCEVVAVAAQITIAVLVSPGRPIHGHAGCAAINERFARPAAEAPVGEVRHTEMPHGTRRPGRKT